MSARMLGRFGSSRHAIAVAAGVMGVTVLLTLACYSSAQAAGDVNSASCPFEAESSPGFRDWLPDCRAFELVSPPYVAGSIPAGPANYAPPISPDGDHLLAIAFGGFAGTEELSQSATEYGAVYEFSRTPEGWTAEAQDPPASLYSHHFLEGWSAAELDRSVWLVPAPLAAGEEREQTWTSTNSGQYVLREGPSQFTVVGPAVAPGHVGSGKPKFSFVRGVSANGRRIVFSVIATEGLDQLWPGDATQTVPGTEEGCHKGYNFANAGGEDCRTSLYEYTVPNGGEPVLVGVENQTHAPWEAGAAHLNEGAQLASDCGTEYDGMSAEGETVFFTAMHMAEACSGGQPPVDEVYARVEGGQRTVDVSEPSAADCGACDDASPAAATFAGSSEDGSKVLFITTQQLFGGRRGEAGENLYLFDFAAPAGERVSLVTPDLVYSEQFAFTGARVAPDGEQVYFESTAEPAIGANASGESAAEEPAGAHLEVYETKTGATSFVAPGESARLPDLSRDGGFMAFESQRDLRGTNDRGEVDQLDQLFLYDAATHAVERASIGQQAPGGYFCEATGRVEAGYGCDGNVSNGEEAPRLAVGSEEALSPQGTYVSTNRSISQHSVDSVADDGAVVFSSLAALTPQAVPGRRVNRRSGALEGWIENVYEYRAGQVYLISPGEEPEPAEYQNSKGGQIRLFGIDESGEDIFFSSADPLVPQDTDTQSSWYDAREQGGFPAPPAPPACSGEACQGTGSPAAVLVSPLAAPSSGETVSTVTNAAAPAAVKKQAPPAPRCRPGRRRKRGKCVKARRASARRGRAVR